KKTGADAVKFQTFTPDTITLNADNKYFKIGKGSPWSGKTLHQLYKECFMPWEWQPKLKKIAEDLGLICFSTPFDKSAVDFLKKMRVQAYKIASLEITDIPLIEYAASTRKPIIISTGIAKPEEIREAIAACKRANNPKIALLKCTSAYPAPLNELNLSLIPAMAADFNCVVGLSDHSLNPQVPVAAVALGARIIEKHFTLSRKLGGPDASFSLEPEEFKAMTEAIRDTEVALGKRDYKLTKKALAARIFARSLFVVRDVKKGEYFTEDNLRSIRPGSGLAPQYLSKVLKKRSKRDIAKGTPLSWDLIL
ncbi:MAG: pseudaminic acid synthase, partial [Candidatus Omnitrophica bacterium]|nr:pseudaminic acid synthase [Candidatus Omnitrophota bacterium]